MNTARLKKIKQSQGYHILGVKPGQQIEIHEKVGQGSNKRIWKFKGLVLKVRKPNHPDGTFTIRGKVAGMTVEKIYPLSFEKFEKVLLLDEYKIRRAKLYYLRDKVGKGAKLKSIASADQKGRDLLAEAIATAAEVNVEYSADNQTSEDVTPESETIDTTPETTSTPETTEEGTTASADEAVESEEGTSNTEQEVENTEDKVEKPVEEIPVEEAKLEETVVDEAPAEEAKPEETTEEKE